MIRYVIGEYERTRMLETQLELDKGKRFCGCCKKLDYLHHTGLCFGCDKKIAELFELYIGLDWSIHRCANYFGRTPFELYEIMGEAESGK